MAMGTLPGAGQYDGCQFCGCGGSRSNHPDSCQCCRPLHGSGKQRKRSLHQKVLCKILGTETRSTERCLREGCTTLPRLLLFHVQAYISYIMTGVGTSQNEEWNGMEWTGLDWNGMEWNGVEVKKRYAVLRCRGLSTGS